MIPDPSGVQVWLASGHTDMRSWSSAMAAGLRFSPMSAGALAKSVGDLGAFGGERGLLTGVIRLRPNTIEAQT